MLKFKIQSKSKRRLEKSLKTYVDNIVKPINIANTKAARDVIKTARKNLDANLTSDSGRLKASLLILDRRNGGLIIDAGTTTEYAINIEEGTKPHELSPSEFAGLMDWVGRKLKAKPKERFITAVWVANKIEEKGTDAQPFLMPAASEVRPRHKAALIKELKKYNSNL